MNKKFLEFFTVLFISLVGTLATTATIVFFLIQMFGVPSKAIPDESNDTASAEVLVEAEEEKVTDLKA